MMYKWLLFCYFLKVDLVCGDEIMTIFRTNTQNSYKWYKHYVDFQKPTGSDCVVSEAFIYFSKLQIFTVFVAYFLRN